MRLRVLSLLAVASAFLGCQEAVLNAPPTATLSLSASPVAIPETGGESTIQAIVRIPSGETVPDGVIVNFFTTLGSIDADARTVGGVATVKLRSAGSNGVATVSALSGAAAVATIDVTFGIPVDVITVSFQPSALPTGGGTADVTVRVLDDDGAGLAGRVVRLSASTPGVVQSAGAPLTTDATGAVRDVVTTTAATTVTAAVDGTSRTGTATLTTAGTTAAAIVLSANPTALPASGGSVAITAFVTDAFGSPVAGETITFAAGIQTVSPTAAVTNASGLATTTLTATATATVRGTIGGITGSLVVTVSGTGSSPLRIQLSAVRQHLTDFTLPDLAACGPASPNPQLPLEIQAKVTDLQGTPVDGVSVTLTVEDLATDVRDNHGGFCSSSPTASAQCCGVAGCPAPGPPPAPPPPITCCTGYSEVCCNSPTLAKSATAVTGGGGAGVALFSFSFEDVDFCKCDFDGSRCTAKLLATAQDASQANVLVLSLAP